MANIDVEISLGEDGDIYLWETITESDTPQPISVNSGRYTVSSEGSYGGGSISIEYGQSTDNMKAIDATNLNFSDDGSYNIEIGRGYIKPVRTGGSSMDVDVKLTPIV